MSGCRRVAPPKAPIDVQAIVSFSWYANRLQVKVTLCLVDFMPGLPYVLGFVRDLFESEQG
jgi:hypothetical protein